MSVLYKRQIKEMEDLFSKLENVNKNSSSSSRASFRYSE
jgi:hypothetical protein